MKQERCGVAQLKHPELFGAPGSGPVPGPKDFKRCERVATWRFEVPNPRTSGLCCDECLTFVKSQFVANAVVATRIKPEDFES